MKNNTPPQFKALAKKISHVEIVILLFLVFMWIFTFYLMNLQRQRYTDKMVCLQERILTLAYDRLEPGTVATDAAWPFDGLFGYIVMDDTTIIASNIERLGSKALSTKEAFGTFIHAPELMKQLRIDREGSDWIRRDKISPRQWISWRIMEGTPYTIALMSDEDSLLDISGFPGFRLLLMICACLCSALLLLALIWALSWLRISAVKGLHMDS